MATDIRAKLSNLDTSAQKARLVIDLVRGKPVDEALTILKFTPNKAAKIIYKVIASAVANSGSEAQDCVITSCRVDNGPVLKRFRPRARGMASGIRKPTAHILVEVEGK